jgi:hypothetical protein
MAKVKNIFNKQIPLGVIKGILPEVILMDNEGLI